MAQKQKQNNAIPKEKRLSSVKIIYFAIFLFVSGMVILYASNSFNSIPVSAGISSNSNSPGNTAQPDPHSGADLTQLQRIKELEAEYARTNSQKTLLDLGHLYNDSGFFDKAIDTYKKYLVKDSRNADVIIDMGVCYFNQENYEQAEKVMKQALEINPNHQIGKFNLGIVNFSKGDMAAAKKWWQESIKINPNSEIAQKAKSLLESH